MGKARVKFVIFIVAMSVVSVGALVGFTLLTQFVAYFQQGADPASIFRGHTLAIPETHQARWQRLPDGVLKKSEEEEILAAYWLAWEALSRAYVTGDTSDIPTYWAGAAYDHALQNMTQDGMTHRLHRLNLEFFSDDGSVVAFRDRAFRMEQTVADVTILLNVDADIVMTLDQGFWRIRSITLYYE